MTLELILEQLANCGLIGEIAPNDKGKPTLFGGTKEITKNISLLPHMPLCVDGYEDEFLILKVGEAWSLRKWIWGYGFEFTFAAIADVMTFLCAIQATDLGIPKEHPALTQLKKLNLVIGVGEKTMAGEDDSLQSGFWLANKGKMYLATISHEKMPYINNGLIKYSEDLQVVVDSIMKFSENTDSN